MARRWCYFEFESEGEIDRWYEAVDAAMREHEGRMGYRRGGRTWDEIEAVSRRDKYYGDLLRLEGFSEEADVGQKVVINKRLYALAKRIGALPLHVWSFVECEEGVPGGVYESPTGREVVPGVFESTGVLLGMARKGEKRSRAELSRADVEGTLRQMNEDAQD